MELWEHPEARVDQLFISASRREVENQDIGPALTMLRKMLEPDVAKRVRGKVVFSINGYDDDPRDLHQIAEVRSWATALDREFPFWFYFMDLGAESTLKFITFSVCQIERVAGGSRIPPEEFQRFMYEHIVAMERLAAHYGDAKQETDARCKEIREFFGLR